MSVGYLSIIILRNRPSDVYLVDFDADSPTYKINENTYNRKNQSEYEIKDNYENEEAIDEYENKEYDENGYEIENLNENEYVDENYEQPETNQEFENFNQSEPELNYEKQEFECIDDPAIKTQQDENLPTEEDELPVINEEIEVSRLKRIRMLFSYSFFISICLAYFFVSLIKTIFSDWSQLYLRRNIKVEPFDGNYFKI